MKSIFDQGEHESLVARINALTPESKGLWGQMSINQMLCHISDPLRDVLGERDTPPVTPPEMWPQLVEMILVEDDWQHNAPTFQPFLQGEGGGGTHPADFETDKASLLRLLDAFCSTPEDYVFHFHPGLGDLNREQHGQITWKHVDHHLREFGV